MSDLNSIILAGRLVRSPVIRSTCSGTVVGLFRMAANRHFKDKRLNDKHETAFVNCVAFGAWTNLLGSCQKGDKILVTGRLKTETREYDGSYQEQLFVVCETVQLLKTLKTEPASNGRVNGNAGFAAPETGSEEIPF